MSDFAPIGDEDWPAEIAGMRDGFAGRLNVYRTMAHDPRLLRAWAPLRQHIVVDNALGTQRSEIVILRTGHRAGAAYEWAHHVSRARACGIEDQRIASIAGPLAAMAEEDAVLARAVDELFDGGALAEDDTRGGEGTGRHRRAVRRSRHRRLLPDARLHREELRHAARHGGGRRTRPTAAGGRLEFRFGTCSMGPP